MTRNEAIYTLKANYPDAHYSELREAVDLAVKVLEEPERKKGEWMYYGYGFTLHKCSLCGFKDAFCEPNNFCPNCGADMREKEKTDE